MLMSEVSREEFEALVERVEELEQRRENDRRKLQQREERIAELEAEVSELRAAQEDSADTEDVEELRNVLDVSVQRRKELEDEVETLADDVEAHDEELDRQDNLLELTIEKRKDLRERVHELAREVEDGTEAEGQTPHYIRPETPLEDLVQLPQEIAEQNLTANQQRMKFVAEGVHEYTTKVPAGRALPWSDLRRVMAAGEGGQAYSMNVGRVMDFFEEFGKEDVEIVDRKDGQKTVVFDDDLVKRIVAYHNQTAQSNNVVSRNEVYG
jgi:DNA repair exonuclease SbcCD ATPase subunit